MYLELIAISEALSYVKSINYNKGHGQFLYGRWHVCLMYTNDFWCLIFLNI